MNKRVIILTTVIVTIILSATTISLIIVFHPKDNNNHQQDITIEEILTKVFQANTSQELESYFTFSFKLQASMDYLFYVLERFKVQYGDIVGTQAFLVNSNYNYHAIMTYGNITGTIGVTTSNLIHTFYISLGPFFDDYLATLTIESITNEIFILPDGGEKSLLLTRENETLLNHSSLEKQSVASIFKLYVLKALREKITSEQTISWSTEIPILNKLKSIPSGEMQTWANGTMVTLETLAEYMIKISDNTATDHLIQFLGRDYVESFLPNDYSFPFLKTADAFKLRYLVSDEDLETYLAMNTTGKKVYLDEVVYDLDTTDIYSLPNLNGWENIMVEKEVEWFFTATEIAQAINEVKSLNVTRQNPGLTFPNQWKAVSYKGGGNIGVLTFAHTLQAENNTWFTLVLFINNYVQPLYDYYVYLELDLQILCAKMLMFLARS